MSPLSPPEANLRASVVVPARDEEALVAACLGALAEQESVTHEEYEVILVLDDCGDATESRAREVSEANPSLRLHFLDGPGKGAGHARRVGMEAACARLFDLGKPSGLIASTDADTVVAPNWLSAQLECTARGVRAIGGRIELMNDDSLPEGVSHWRQEQGKLRYQRLLSHNGGPCSDVMEHWQFSGASLALTAAVYEEIGGLEPLAALEDEYLERVLRQRGVSIERPLAVKVKTSARRTGRAERGLAQDLALATWFRRNTYRASDFGVTRILRTKKHSVSLILAGQEYPSEALEDFENLREAGVLDEIVSVDSLPGTNGRPPVAEVYPAEELMPNFGPIRGYGDLLWRGLSVVRGDLVVVLDPDYGGDFVRRVCGLLGPLMENEDLSLVKGFRSPAGHLSELVARPMINLYHPRLAGLVEPLSGDVAARSQLLRRLPFPVGSGIHISLLLDAAEQAGTATLAQVYVGEQRTPPEHAGSEAAYAVLAAAANRRSDESRNELIPGPLFLPGPEDLTTRRVPVEERPPLESLSTTE